jgi:serine/threonine protein kinase
MSPTAEREILQSVCHYNIFEKIAESRSGTVYKARDKTNGEIVAVKLLETTGVNDTVSLDRFAQECRAATSLNDPHIVRALDFGLEGLTAYLVMEYVDGESLGYRIERDGPLPAAEALGLVAQVAGALGRMHRSGFIHRNVKPDNILLARDGQAKLTNFGLAKFQNSELNLTRTGRRLGTPNFMAPEQFLDAKRAGARADIYALAATLYIAVTGEVPFGGLTITDIWTRKLQNDLPAPRSLVPSLDERTDWAIRRAMSYEWHRRPASCAEFLEDLTGRSADLPCTAEEEVAQLWYVVAADNQGAKQHTTGRLEEVRRSIREERYGAAENIRVSPTKEGPFKTLGNWAEFRDLVIEPAHLCAHTPTPPRPTRPAKMVVAGARDADARREPSETQPVRFAGPREGIFTAFVMACLWLLSFLVGLFMIVMVL